jgi:CRISPR-associated protein Csm5
MNQFNCYRIFFTPLSPTHIGTGNSYEPTNYVIEDGALYEFDTGTAMGILSQQDRAELVRITAGQPGSGMIQAVQRFFYDRRSRLLPAAVNRSLVSNGVAGLYSDRIGKIAQREARGRRILNVLEIARTAYNPISRQPTLVGSSLKGAIRTALLDQVNDARPTNERRGLHEFQGNRDLFRYSQPRLELERDPMRLVQISDATWQGDANSPTTEVFFATNVKKVLVANRQDQRRSTRAETSGPPQTLECIAYLRYRAFAAQLNIQSVDAINQAGSLPDADLRFDMRRIASACNAFYQPILQQEIQSLSASAYLEGAWHNVVKKILEDSRLTSGDAFLLRVGRHCGAESLTLRGVRKIGIRGRGGSVQEQSSPTTVWLAARDRGQTTGLLPFGWMIAEFCSLEQRAADENISLKTLCVESERVLRARLQPPPKRQLPQQTGTRSSEPRAGATRHRETGATSQEPASPPQQATFATTQVIWKNATITWQPGPRIATAVVPDQKPAQASGKAAEDFLKTLTEQQRRQLLERRKELTNVKAVVEISGNQRTLKGLQRG